MKRLFRIPAALRRFRHFSLVLLSAVLAACGGGGGGGVVNPPPGQKLGSITVAQSTVTLAAGSTSSIAVTALDETGVAISGASGFTYQSSALAVAEVSASGTILGISAGSAIITVSLTLGGVTKTTTSNVTVNGTLPGSANVVANSAGTDFQPGLVVITRGGNVSFSFGVLAHNVTFAATAGAPGNIANSTSVVLQRTFDTVGNFNYQCTLHGGMNGSVFVR